MHSLQFNLNCYTHLETKNRIRFVSFIDNYCLPIHLNPSFLKNKEEKLVSSLITTMKLHSLNKSIDFQISASGVLSFNMYMKNDPLAPTTMINY